jgi:hypothetical protein
MGALFCDDRRTAGTLDRPGHLYPRVLAALKPADRAISDDPGEKNNLAAEFPRLAGELRAEAEEWRAALEKHWAAKKEKAL